MRSCSDGVLHDQALCRRAQAGDPDAQTEVFSGCDRLVRSRIDHVIGVGRWPANVSLADAEQEARMALFRALLSWDGRRPLTTLAVTCIDRQLRRWRAQTFPVLHMSRAAYAAAHGQVPAPASLDDPGGGDSRPLADRVTDTTGWGRDPLAILEGAETVREFLAAIRAGAGPARPRTAASQPAHRRRRASVRVVAVLHSGSPWSSLRLVFGTAGAARRPARRAARRATPLGHSAPWQQLRLNLDAPAA